MKIRNYAKSVGFEVVGKITYIGYIDRSHRLYIDEAKNWYLIDTILGDVSITPANQRGIYKECRI